MEAYIQKKRKCLKGEKKDKTWLKSKIWSHCSLNHNRVNKPDAISSSSNFY